MKRVRQFFLTLLVLAGLSVPSVHAQNTEADTSTRGPIDSLQIFALRAEPGAPALYEVAFVLRDTLHADAELMLQFPDEFDLNDLEIVGSKTVNGGWRFERRNQDVTLRRTGLGAPVPPGRRVTVTFGLIRNPADLNAAQPVIFRLKYARNGEQTAAMQAAVTARQRSPK